MEEPCPLILWKGAAIAAALKNFNGLGVALRYTFTNTLLREEDVYDSYCNECMKLGNNGLNEVLVNSPILEKYIREKYPKYRIISSTTKGIKTIDGLNKELEKYPIVVADYTLNNKEGTVSDSKPGQVRDPPEHKLCRQLSGETAALPLSCKASNAAGSRAL